MEIMQALVITYLNTNKQIYKQAKNIQFIGNIFLLHFGAFKYVKL